MTALPSLAEADRFRPAVTGPDVASGVQLLLSGEHADPRAAQAVILLPVFLEILLRQLTGGAFDGWFELGSVVAAVPTAGAVLIGLGWLSPRWTIALPLLDMVALGLYRQSTDTALGVAVALGVTFLDERLSWPQLVGAGIVLAAARAYVGCGAGRSWQPPSHSTTSP